MKRNSVQRDGTVVVATAVCLTVIMGFTALSVDGGLLMDSRRQVQSATDAAALAAADDLYLNWWSNKGLDPSGTARAAALATAGQAGFVNGVNGCVVTVNIPPTSGKFVGKAGHTEVLISVYQTRFFSKIWGSDQLPIGGRAVARGRSTEIKEAILCLAPTGKGSLSAAGGGTVTVVGAPIQVDSNDASAMVANGGGRMVSSEFDVNGAPGWSTPGGGSFVGPIVSYAPQIPDPLASLPAPDPNTMTIQSHNKLTLSGNGSKTFTLQPGVYKGGVSITGQVNVILAPGIYYMDGGGFSSGGGGSLSGSGVMIYNAPQSNSDVISLAGLGATTLSMPTSGPYKGILLFQDRNTTPAVNVTGNGAMSLSGAFYAAKATLNVTGNGTNDVIGSQYISYNLVTGGNGSFKVDWNPDLTPGSRDILLVE